MPQNFPGTLSTERQAPRATPERRAHTGGRALVWDAQNTSSILVARSLRERGWSVDWIGPASSPWGAAADFDGERTVVAGLHDETLERVLWQHPLDALFLHGDDQVRWLLARWGKLPERIRRHLPAAESLQLALSKDRSMQLARSLDVPVLETERCTSASDVAGAARRLGARGEVVLKGEGGSAGSAVVSVRAGHVPSREAWKAVTRHSPVILVQRRLQGPRVMATVVYDHGVERAAVAHEKIAAYPFHFGPTAYGVTRHVQEVHEYTQRLYRALGWHGISNVEFRQDLSDGRWYFMEINPRANCSLGIQALAGIDVGAVWAAVCEGRGEESSPGRAYRDGVRYAWTVRGLALAMRRPWNLPTWGLRTLFSENSDLSLLDPTLRQQAFRHALWLARHG